jgi:Holliday junction resolvasome RuvABC ATP-dependent DNA helicase subunit
MLRDKMLIKEMKFEDFVGNVDAVSQIRLLASDAAANGGKLPHMGFFGASGFGKTTMASIVAEHIGRKFVYINSVAVKSPMLFRGILTHPENNIYGAVILLDECHRLPAAIMDNLLSVLEQPAVLVTSYRNQIVRDELPDQISFIFATTHAGKIMDTLLSRLEIVEFHEYSTLEKQIIAAKFLKRQYNFNQDLIDIDAITEIGRRSRNGRQVVKICENMMRYMKYKGLETLNIATVEHVFKIIGIDDNGLTKRDKLYLGYLAETGQCGLDTLEAYLNVPKRDIKDKIEPWLLRKNLVARQSSGRALTPRGAMAARGDRIDI